MAELPPRKNATPTKLTKLLISPLQVLLQMGFPKHRAEKALAATGYRNVQLASDWLLAHVNDPTLDDQQPREYLLYLCPAGYLQSQLQEFWARSVRECGRNGAHEFLPHVTLVPPFKVPDSSVPSIVSLLERITEHENHPIPELRLETYISQNFMGFFLNQDSAEVIKVMAFRFARELAQINVAAEAHTQALHLTLAYNFPSGQFSTLEYLVRALNPNNGYSHWQLRLYSRDIRLSGKKVYKVVFPHVPRETDELELLLGDFVYVDPEACNNSIDGWIEGISWLTGCSGFLPKNYVEKTAESDAWTLHKSVELNPSADDLDEIDGISASSDQARRLLSQVSPELGCNSGKSSPTVRQETSPPRGVAVRPTELSKCTENYVNSDLDMAGLSPVVERPLAFKQGPRRLFIVRHGERVDFTFGTWIPYCFDESGKYVRKDLNMPLSVPKRQGSPESFFKDCPLTILGETQAGLLGQALRSAGESNKIQHVYCSPSLRSLQTCQNILKGLEIEQSIPISLEPGLFEWLAWYQDSMPQFLTPSEMLDAGFRLREQHQYFIDFSELCDRRESAEQYYMRSHYVTQCALRCTEHIGGDVLLIGHASTLDACSRQLVGGLPRSAQELSRIVHRIPYCSLAAVQQQQPRWKLIEPPVPPMTYSANLRFDWQTLLP
ncbi:hypothetical protein DAPPUDRAFT_318481 [Daphnia pulex]|uniref:Ecdysteroid-phosphate phosphatase n=1 Tax=Daphnia pulex TaxID=6669 RepID=E9GIZ3_DAPPU|nr:hypothetical protein DAPPUDRAFT_318481 [Daphnia pulex]|eukprot:EFX80352.1 hypothetical protein DAPPUDRAFT_318481 [Daphnia pulex]